MNKALSDGNLSSFNVHQNQWLPDATVQLVPRRGADTAQFSYTAQELLKNVRLGQEPGPVIIAGKTPQLVMARATKNQTGSLLLTQSLAPLATTLRTAMPEGSALSVTYGGSPLFDNKQQIGRASCRERV